MTLRPLPDFLYYGDLIEFEEDVETEFKELGETHKPISKIKDHCRKYLNGFVNSRGGYIFFGIKDTQEVEGLVITKGDKDHIRRLVSEVVNCMVPPVDAKMSETKFIPVLKKSDPSAPPNLQVSPTDKSITRYVFVASIFPDNTLIHFTTGTSQSAYVRSGSRTLEMSTDEMARRITFDHQTDFIVKSYDPPKFEYIPKTLGPEFLNYLLDHQDKGPTTRKELLFSAVNFLTAKRTAVKTSCIKVVMFYGSSLIRTIQLDKELCNVIATDKEKFPATYKEYHIDLKGSTTEPLSLESALVKLIHLIGFDIDDSASVATHQPPVCSSADGATVSPSDRTGETANTTKEAIDTTLSDKCQSLSCARPSACQDQTSPRDAHLVSDAGATKSPGLKKSILSLLPQILPFEALSENLISEVYIGFLRIVYMGLLRRINDRGETVLLCLRDIRDKIMLDGLLPTGIQSVAVITYGSRPEPFEPYPDYKLLYVPSFLIQTG
ncbi:Putative ATP-binding protein [Giardia duodenalis]|uniref:Putative ATP-binding protein n=1 Tax=Giardia intestinalis TaxID=5741 RepID=V6T7S1_GIAIN|nr:Putative ATP-binding protein [Giardia intestinalis]